MLLLVACEGAGSSRSPEPDGLRSQVAPAKTPTESRATVRPVDVDGSATAEPIIAHDPEATRAALEARYAEYEIVTLLPRDAIPAIDQPEFMPAAEADDWYEPDELVLGVAFDGEARAYSVPLLSRHEIVNDTVAGVKIAVTW
jgi:hypothetical protein